jgi:GTPase SAR1 family protein
MIQFLLSRFNISIDISEFFAKLLLWDKKEGKNIAILAFGAEEVGKTAFKKRLERPKNSDVSPLFGGATTGCSQTEISCVINKNGTEESVVIEYIDVGGDEAGFQIRRDRLLKVRPIGILFFLDHAKPVKRGKTRQQIDDGKIEPERMERHRKAFQEFHELIKNEPIVKESCKVFVLVVNKYDCWQQSHALEDFNQTFKEDIRAILDAYGQDIQMSDIMKCSVFSGDGIRAIVQTLFDLANKQANLASKQAKSK